MRCRVWISHTNALPPRSASVNKLDTHGANGGSKDTGEPADAGGYVQSRFSSCRAALCVRARCAAAARRGARPRAHRPHLGPRRRPSSAARAARHCFAAAAAVALHLVARWRGGDHTQPLVSRTRRKFNTLSLSHTHILSTMAFILLVKKCFYLGARERGALKTCPSRPNPSASSDPGAAPLLLRSASSSLRRSTLMA